MGNRWGNSVRLYLGGSKITADGDCSHEIKRHLLLGKKAVINLWKWKWKVKSLHHVRLLVTPWTVADHGILQARVLEWVAISFSNNQPIKHIKKQRHHFANKGLPSFSSSYVHTWGLNHKEGWALKIDVFELVLEDFWESLGLQGDPTSPFWRRSALGFLWKEWC